MKNATKKSVAKAQTVAVITVTTAEQAQAALPAVIAKAVADAFNAANKAVNTTALLVSQLLADGKDSRFLISPLDNNGNFVAGKSTATPEQYSALQYVAAQSVKMDSLWAVNIAELSEQIKTLKAELKAATTAKAKNAFSKKIAALQDVKEKRTALSRKIAAKFGDWRKAIESEQVIRRKAELVSAGMDSKQAATQAKADIAKLYGKEVLPAETPAEKQAAKTKPSLADLQIKAAAFITELAMANETPLLPKEHNQLVKLLEKFSNAENF